MDSNLDYTKNNDSGFNSFEDIDFSIIFNFIKRNKKFIRSISIASIFLGILISFFPKRTWQGQFQIVLSSEDNSKKLPSLKPFSKTLANTLAGNNSLKTEVGILKSPSVLLPAYKIAKNNNEKFSYNHDAFSFWKNKQLSIELERNTSILNIFYKDTNKNIILPVLKKMSSTYQEYSGKRKKRINQNSEAYLKKQIQFFKEKSAKSLREAQMFAIDQDLVYFDLKKNDITDIAQSTFSPDLDISNNEIDMTSPSFSTFLPLNINIENVRASAANEIRKIDLQLEKIADLNQGETLQYVSSMIPTLNKNRNIQDLDITIQAIEAELIDLRSKYTDDDIGIKRLLEKRKYAVNLRNQRAVDFLKAKRLENEAKMEAAFRPKGVLLKYKELIRNASRDESTLINLEDELRIIELGKTRSEPPWELITKPTLSQYPVSNVTRDSILISFFVGTSLGILYCFFKEKNSDKIFEYKDLKKLIGLELGQIIKYKCNQLNEENNNFFNEYIKTKFNKGINLIKLGSLEENKIEIIKENLISNKIKIDIFDSILSLKNSENNKVNFLILELGFFTFAQVKTLKKYLELFDINLAGTIFIEKD